MFNMMDMMKQAQQLQSKMQEMHTELEQLEIEGEAGAGMVRIVLNGRGDVRRVAIDPSLLKPEDAEIIEDLIVAAFGDAKRKSQEVMQEKMKQVTGGLPLPPGLGF
ncbi:MAG: YbaB/EbfC family nucleoid-associated protein [Pseudomonadota bacterium]